MYSQDDDCFLFPFPDVEPFQGPPELGVSILASRLEAGSQPILEEAGCYLGGITFDPLRGGLVTSSDSDVPPTQVAQVLPELHQGFWAPQILSDQDTANLFPHHMEATNQIAAVDVGVEHNVVETENRTLVKFPSRRLRILAKRRALRSRKSECIEEIRTLMHMEPRTPKVEVLCVAIKRLGSAVPRLAHESNANQMRLVYEVLHESTGSQGRLRHVQCLNLVIKALKGLPTLDPVFVGSPGRSIQ